MDISNPSLLIFSSRMPRWRSPRPRIVTEFDFPLAPSTCKATSFSDSLIKRDLISFRVNLSPYLPAKGEVLTLMLIAIIGGSILAEGITDL